MKVKEQPVEEKEQPVEEEEKLEVEKDVINPTEIPEIEKETKPEIKINVEAWTPKTNLGRKVKAGEITDIDNILDSGLPILEEQIVDMLMPNLQSELLMIGQSKGKFGGGSRRIFKQTQKKTPEGNKPSFACMAVVGNSDGYVGIGYGKSKDTVPAREKAIRNAKLAVFKIRRGAGSWEDTSAEPHSIPFAVQGKCGSIRMNLLPAPKGKGLIVEQECAKILRLAGIESIYSKTFGQTRSKVNVISACIDALKKLNEFKPRPEGIKAVAMIEGRKHK
ncbi:MAG TPA: 30S ribosomal protein S5 [Candidatus Nanoarchaeia archaeon]|nr:30S ribosomal protein S5 [Candidatus Nanoarchaeia archaeon]